MWGPLPIRCHFDPDNHRWSLGSYHLCFKNRFVYLQHYLAQLLTLHQTTLNLLLPRSSPSHPPPRAHSLRRPLPANYDPSSTPIISPSIRILDSSRERSTPILNSLPKLIILAKHIRSFFGSAHDLYNHRNGHFPGPLVIPFAILLVDTHISRRSRTPAPEEDHAIL